MNNILKLENFKANIKDWFLEQLSNMSASQALQTISDLYDELHKPTYPTTYVECCKVIGYGGIISFAGLADEEEKLYRNFIVLKRCRDAYWKIAGEEMGLGKSWKPDWEDSCDKYTISFKCDKIFLNNTMWYSEILAFPTPEIRNKFYEHFEEIIENCKELL